MPSNGHPVELEYASVKRRRSNTLFIIALIIALVPYAIDVGLYFVVKPTMQKNTAARNEIGNWFILILIFALVGVTHLLFHIISFVVCVAARTTRRSTESERTPRIVRIATAVCYGFFVIDVVGVVIVIYLLKS